LAKCIVCGEQFFFGLKTEFTDSELAKIAGFQSKIQVCKKCSICSVCGKKLKKDYGKELFVGIGPKLFCEKHQNLVRIICSRCGKEKPIIGLFVCPDEIICKDCGKCIICGKNDKEIWRRMVKEENITRLKKGSPIFCQEHKKLVNNLCSRCGKHKLEVVEDEWSGEIICKDCRKCGICGTSNIHSSINFRYGERWAINTDLITERGGLIRCNKHLEIGPVTSAQIAVIKRRDELRELEEWEKNRRDEDKLIRLKKMKKNIESGINIPNSSREHIPVDIRGSVWSRDRGKCRSCGSNKNLHFDHIIPVSKGGATTTENLQVLCKDCNLKKSDHI